MTDESAEPATPDGTPNLKHVLIGAFVASAVILGAWAAFAFVYGDRVEKHLGPAGDATAPFTGIFTALALVFAVYATLLQRQDLVLQREELQLQRQEMKDATVIQKEISARQAQVATAQERAARAQEMQIVTQVLRRWRRRLRRERRAMRALLVDFDAGTVQVDPGRRVAVRVEIEQRVSILTGAQRGVRAWIDNIAFETPESAVQRLARMREQRAHAIEFAKYRNSLRNAR